MMLWMKLLLAVTLSALVKASPLSGDRVHDGTSDCNAPYQSECPESCPPEVITYGQQSPLLPNLPVTIEEPVMRETPGATSRLYRPDPFTGKSYGVSVFNPAPPTPPAQSLGAFNIVRQDPAPRCQLPPAARPREPSMQIEVIPVNEGVDPTTFLEPLPVCIQEPVLPASISQKMKPPPELLRGLCARIDKVVLPAAPADSSNARSIASSYDQSC